MLHRQAPVGRAIALKPEIPVELHFRPYFLNPWIPREGISREEYLTTKFGSPERYRGIAQRASPRQPQPGLAHEIHDGIKRQPNTPRLPPSHPVGRSEAGQCRTYEAAADGDLYFTEGGDLTDREVLVGAAADSGLDADLVRQRLATDEDVARVEREANSAKEAGIDGVPCFILGGLLAVKAHGSRSAQAIERGQRICQARGAE